MSNGLGQGLWAALISMLLFGYFLHAVGDGPSSRGDVKAVSVEQEIGG